ncbi:unnamed protein product [Cunninghamella echinulata]
MRSLQVLLLGLVTLTASTLALFEGEGTYNIKPKVGNKTLSTSSADNSVILLNESTEPDKSSQQWTVSTSGTKDIYYIINVSKDTNGYITLARSNEKLFASTTSKYKGVDVFRIEESSADFYYITTAYDYILLKAHDGTAVGGLPFKDKSSSGDTIQFSFTKVAPPS